MALCLAAMRDLRRACIHEYAHWAVARHFGAAGFVTIVASRTGPPSWGGRFQMYGELADGEWRIVALAGTVAECVEEDPGVDALAIIASLRQDPSMLSAIDAQLAQGFGDDDVLRCLAIVKAAWHEIAREAGDRASSVVSESRG
jgi:hypothetical protein